MTQLVYDVGMHNGDDTAYYLHKGYRVVAIDANPAMIAHASRRFGAEIAAGRLRVLHAAVAAEPGEVEFHVPLEGDDRWSSLDRGNAAKGGGATRAVKVGARRFDGILAEHGAPFFLKIDIEGADAFCLAALTVASAPPWLSLEMSHERGDTDLRTLDALGYRRFQCIRQNDFFPMHSRNIDAMIRMRRARARGGWRRLAVRGMRRVMKLQYPPRDGAYAFASHSSGSFGPHLRGPWMSLAEACMVWERLRAIDHELGAAGLGEWFDFHAGR